MVFAGLVGDSGCRCPSRNIGGPVTCSRPWTAGVTSVSGNSSCAICAISSKREVDFLIVRDRKPWFLVEVKHSDDKLSDSLRYFQAQTQARHAFKLCWKNRS